ncbi:MAG: DNA repair protein RecN [Clostridia bacterium]|nr:DNA repair protein RecN [Clostridia bacterium]
MLESLHIENLAVIKSTDLEPGRGFTALTGETGAGKSVIIDSINFLMGRKTQRDLIRTGEKKLFVSALFSELKPEDVSRLSELGIETDGGQVLLERSRDTEGKNICRINGRAVTNQILRSAGDLLVSLHGQNDTRALESPEARVAVTDAAAHTGPLLSEYREIYGERMSAAAELAKLKKSAAEKARLRDMLEYQIKDIGSRRLKEGEEEELLAERELVRNYDKIRKQTDIAVRALRSNEKGITAPYLVSRAADAVGKLSGAVPQAAALKERLDSCRYELDDIADEIGALCESFSDGGESADARLDRIEGRLEEISKLKRKYGQSVGEILEFAARAGKELATLDGSDRAEKELEERISVLDGKLAGTGRRLSEARRAAAAAIEKKIRETLIYLDMPKVSFEVRVADAGKPQKDGLDTVDFMLSANPGEEMLPLSRCASGGELSRVMLAIKCALAEADAVPTLIFDEIDTGISGSTSRKLGRKLREAAASAQVICVTHSAQIASLAQTHIKITKSLSGERAQTTVSVLDREGRIAETARILGGISVTAAQRQAAVDMIDAKD